MALTDPQRRALYNATHKGGAQRYKTTAPDRRRTIPIQVARRLIRMGLLREINGVYFTTKEGRAELAKPVPNTPLYLAHGGELEETDYTHLRHRAIDDLEVVKPTHADVKRAREQGAKQRESFRKDLEQERRKRKNERVHRLFRAA